MPLPRKHFVLMDTAGDGNAGGGSSGKPEPETFSREYVTELRAENASYRRRGQDAEAKAKAAEEAAAKAVAEANEKAAATAKEAESKANQRIIMAELRTAAVKAGMVDLDGLKLADLSAVKLDDKGEVEGADALMESMKKAKPYLFKDTSSTSSTGKPPKASDDKPKTATEMTAEEWKDAKRKHGLP